MPSCFFVSDLHGSLHRYRCLWDHLSSENPDAVFLGGDLLPHSLDFSWQDNPDQLNFITDFLVPGFSAIKLQLNDLYPKVFLILGNDDPRANEPALMEGQKLGLWEYIHGRKIIWKGFTLFGYSCIPPSPFMLKDWERYDVSMFVDPGCVSPEEGGRTAGPTGREIRFTTIAQELNELAGQEKDYSNTILLSHCPPHKCNLDRAALDGKMVDYVPLDVHIGSIAIQRFIQDKQPLLTLHGHVHESRTLTGSWMQKFGLTTSYNAANESPALALIRFDPHQPSLATLELIDP